MKVKEAGTDRELEIVLLTQESVLKEYASSIDLETRTAITYVKVSDGQRFGFECWSKGSISALRCDVFVDGVPRHYMLEANTGVIEGRGFGLNEYGKVRRIDFFTKEWQNAKTEHNRTARDRHIAGSIEVGVYEVRVYLSPGGDNSQHRLDKPMELRLLHTASEDFCYNVNDARNDNIAPTHFLDVQQSKLPQIEWKSNHEWRELLNGFTSTYRPGTQRWATFRFLYRSHDRLQELGDTAAIDCKDVLTVPHIHGDQAGRLSVRDQKSPPDPRSLRNYMQPESPVRYNEISRLRGSDCRPLSRMSKRLSENGSPDTPKDHGKAIALPSRQSKQISSSRISSIVTSNEPQCTSSAKQQSDKLNAGVSKDSIKQEDSDAPDICVQDTRAGARIDPTTNLSDGPAVQEAVPHIQKDLDPRKRKASDVVDTPSQKKLRTEVDVLVQEIAEKEQILEEKRILRIQAQKKQRDREFEAQSRQIDDMREELRIINLKIKAEDQLFKELVGDGSLEDLTLSQEPVGCEQGVLTDHAADVDITADVDDDVDVKPAWKASYWSTEKNVPDWAQRQHRTE